MSSIVLVAHNIRSTHNVGSLLRTADGLGVEQVFLSGYTPYPHSENDSRLPHVYKKIHSQIQKTALGAENTISWRHESDIEPVLASLQSQGYVIAALEQTPDSIPLPELNIPEKMAVIIGREVEGIEPEVLRLCAKIVEIPMSGKKESFNVAIAAAIFLSYCQFG